jgi:hypothetical protein
MGWKQYLKISWTILCSLAAVLLIALWIRSYWRIDIVFCPTSRPILMNSANGIIQVNILPKNIGTGWGPGCGYMSLSTESESRNLRDQPSWSWISFQKQTAINFPAYAIATLFTFGAAAPWLSIKRFSLRSLLIATTVIAAVLGIAVWSLR